MRWFLAAVLGMVAALGVGALRELGEEGSPQLAANALLLPTDFSPPGDPRGDDAVLRVALSAGLPSAHVPASELAREARLTNAWRDEIAMGSQLAPVARVALPEPTFATLAASAALLAAVARVRSCRRRARQADAARPLLPR